MDIIGIIKQRIKLAKENKTCSNCDSTLMGPEHFVDELSRKEAAISALCQKCQDKAFDDDDE